MKLNIGENIRKYRKKNGLTQEELAYRLGVSYQSVSRWENGATYPDIELLPAISELLSCSVDRLMGIPDEEKEKAAAKIFDELRRECMKKEYSAERVVSIIRDIRRNYMDSRSAWRPWTEGNDHAFRDPRILPEVRLMAEAYLERNPMCPETIKTMAYIEDEDRLESFLKKYTTPFDCSEHTLLLDRYIRRGDSEKFEPERKYQLYCALSRLLCPKLLLDLEQGEECRAAADEFMCALLSLVRRDAADEEPDIWTEERIELGLKRAERLTADGKFSEALSQTETAVVLLEKAMKITDEVRLPVSCRFLEGMEWTAKEDWFGRRNDPDSPEERMIFISTQMSDLRTCCCLFPSIYYDTLCGAVFAPLRSNPSFANLCDRVEALVVTRPKAE